MQGFLRPLHPIPLRDAKAWVDEMGGGKNREVYYGIIARKIDASKKFRDFRDHGYVVFDPEDKG